MTLIQIRKVNGVPMGRPVNINREQTPAWAQFEQSVTEHEAPGCEEGEAEGELIEVSFNLGLAYPAKRQIWRIVPTPEKVEVKEHPVIQRLEKVEQTVAELANLVNELAIAVRKRFEATH